MKRLVICCDGTWKAESTSTVSNIVKIAQTIRREAPGQGGAVVNQSVAYVAGPGARGYLADRLFGGALGGGFGLESNLASAYFHLAANWEPGDEIYIFGFSRGAYVARALAGMIDRLGIMTSRAVIDGRFVDALRLYRRRAPGPWDPDPPEWKGYRRSHSHYPAKINFLGVFETVGALGVPGSASRRYRFHDVRLPSNVHCARQALAIDERRRNFEPCLWETSVELHQKFRSDFPRIKQVWFEGVHSDIGGGYHESGLSDIVLRWMATEASEIGLVFDWDRLEDLGEDTRADGSRYYALHNSLGLGYRVLNVLRTLRNPRNRRFYSDSWRRLYAPGDQDVRLASSALDKLDYRPANLRRWRAEQGEGVPPPEDRIEKTDAVLAGNYGSARPQRGGGITKAGTGSDLMADRKVRVLCPAEDRVVISEPTQVAFEIVVTKEAAAWRGRDPLLRPVTLRVLLQSDEASVRPMTQLAVLDTDRTSKPIVFEIVPDNLGEIELKFRVYDERNGQLLQEVRAPLEVKRPDKQKAEP